MPFSAITDALNRGLVAGNLGAPADIGALGLNALLAVYGYGGHKLGLLGTEQMPKLVERPFLGSEHLGDLLERYGVVSSERRPIGELLAAMAPLAPAVLAQAAKATQATRTGRNLARAIGVVENSPTRVAADEIARMAKASGGNEMAVAVSPRGVAGPVRVGVQAAVSPGRKSRLSKYTPETDIEDFHTHQSDGDVYYGIHPGDVQQSAGRRATSVVHTDALNRPTVYSERVVSPGALAGEEGRWSHSPPDDYRNWLAGKGSFTSNVPGAKYYSANYGDLGVGSPAGFSVIKSPGGNWLDGSVESAVKPLKLRVRTEGVNGHTAEHVATDTAVNNWIEKQLSSYIKNDMATDRDPIRALAEKWAVDKPKKLAEAQVRIDALNAKGQEIAARRGVPEEYLTAHRQQVLKAEKDKQLLEQRQGLHVAQDTLNFRPEMHGKYLEKGQTAVAVSPEAKVWEGASDLKVFGNTAGDYQSGAASDITSRNPWLSKVAPDAKVYSVSDPSYLKQDLGFDHLIDELRNAVNPASGLPADLLLKYDHLPKITVPQAVERVADINAWRAAQKAEADMARANNAATFLHKEYPEKGFKWVEVKKPEGLLEGYTVVDASDKFGQRFAVNGPSGEVLSYGKTPDDAVFEAINSDGSPNYSLLQDALKYEGDTMQHCVGGYCDQVATGGARIFSLRDSKGRPHTTIEVRPSEIEGHETINQIKGPMNRAPNPEVLPYVQDFVRSGKWDKVYDLENADLVHVHPDSDVAKLLSKTGDPVPAYVTQDELTNLLNRSGGEGFAHGGLAKTKQRRVPTKIPCCNIYELASVYA